METSFYFFSNLKITNQNNLLFPFLLYLCVLCVLCGSNNVNVFHRKGRKER